MNHLNDILAGLNIKGQCVNFEQHRHLAFYDVALKPGTTVSRIESRSREIALGLRTKTAPIVRVIPEQGIVRLHVAVKEAETLSLGRLFDATTLPSDMALPFLLGEDDEGEKLWVDFARHPHTLIAGGTGSGKSVLLHTLIANAANLVALNKRKIQIFLSDPKRVEFKIYENKDIAPLVKRIEYTYEGTLAMLNFIWHEMEARYEALAGVGAQSVAECPNAFPYILVIIDEVADLMLQDRKRHDFENIVTRLAQKARAAGIHLVLATQRPSRDVLTGTIKANFPARISCRVSSRVDSQVILDSPGAENLLGRGDAVIRNHNIDRGRFQVAYSDPRQIIRNYSALAVTE